MNRNNINFYKKNGYLVYPKIVQIEITNQCPLKCKQCYKTVDAHCMDLKTFYTVIEELAKFNVKSIMLNGGEPLIHPKFNEILRCLKRHNMNIYCFTSGFGLNAKMINELASTDTNLSISLNGSTEVINSLSRDGYNYGINALNLLMHSNKTEYGINWVSRADNVHDFKNMIALALSKKCKWINVITNKICNGTLESKMNLKEYIYLSNIIHECSKDIKINIETCNSLLLSFMNIKRGSLFKGCIAGKEACFINVDGYFMPCSHLYYPEKWDSISDYWYKSPTLNDLRKKESREFCEDCCNENKCSFCHALSKETHDNLLLGYKECPIKNVNIDRF